MAEARRDVRCVSKYRCVAHILPTCPQQSYRGAVTRVRASVASSEGSSTHHSLANNFKMYCCGITHLLALVLIVERGLGRLPLHVQVVAVLALVALGALAGAEVLADDGLGVHTCRMAVRVGGSNGKAVRVRVGIKTRVSARQLFSEGQGRA